MTNAMVLLVLHRELDAPELVDVARDLAIDPKAFDRDFGIVILDPSRDLWCVRVRKDALPAHLGDNAWIAPDPDIQTFD